MIASLVRSPVCIAVRNRCTHVNVVQLPGGPGGGLVGVQHRGGRQQLPDPVHERRQQPGGLPRMPATNPAETFTPVSAATSRAARATAGSARRPPGRPWRAPRPVLHPPGHPGRCQPDRDFPALRALLRGDWYSVTVGGGGGDASNTCRFCTVPSTGSPVRSCPQQPHAAARHNTVSPGWGDCFSVEDRAPGCSPGRARTCRAATGPAASSDTGCPMTAASTTFRSPYPDAAAGPLPARPAPRSARPARPARGGQLIAGRGRLAQPRVEFLQLRDPRTQPRHLIRCGHMRRTGHKPHSTTAGGSYQGDTRSQLA